MLLSNVQRSAPERTAAINGLHSWKRCRLAMLSMGGTKASCPVKANHALQASTTAEHAVLAKSISQKQWPTR